MRSVLVSEPKNGVSPKTSNQPPGIPTFSIAAIRDGRVDLKNRENLKYEDQITLPSPTRSTVFGVPLEDLMGYNGEKGGVPRVVKDCIQYVRGTGMCATPI